MSLSSTSRTTVAGAAVVVIVLVELWKYEAKPVTAWIP